MTRTNRVSLSALILLVAPLAAVSCAQSERTVTCGNDWLCPDGMVCVPGRDSCGDPDAVEACITRAEGEFCELGAGDGAPAASPILGVCREGICKVGCGNLYVDVAEVCDGAPPEQDNCVLRGFDLGTLACSSSCDAVMTNQCQVFGWERFPADPDWQLTRIWGTSHDNLYVPGGVGQWGLELIAECTLVTRDCGRIFYYDGQRWQAHETHTPPLTDVWGSAHDDIYIVGFGQTILHSTDGRTWTAVYPSDCDPLLCENFSAIWGSGPSDIYVASVFGVILHYDGASWTEMQTPDRGNRILTVLWGSGPDDIYVGGTGGLIWRYDGNPGGEWVEMTTGPEHDVRADVLDISGTGPDNVIASGEDRLLMRYDGNADGVWTIVTQGVTEDRSLTAILALDPREIYVAANEAPLLRYNSVTGELTVASESAAVMSTIGMWGQATDDFWMVGRDGMILRRRPSFGWTTTDVAAGAIRGLWIDELSQQQFAVGDELWHYRDGVWNQVAVEHDGGFQDVWGSRAADVFVVTDAGEILHYDGDDWSPMAVDGEVQRLLAVWGRDAADVFAVGDGGAILHYDGNAGGLWRRMGSPVNDTLHGVSGNHAGDVYAVGDGGVILRYDGNETLMWTEQHVVAPLPLKSVWVGITGEAFAVGDEGIIVHYDGNAEGRWWPINSSTLNDLTDVWGDRANNIYAVGVAGRIVHYDGAQWTRVRAGDEPHMNTVFGTSNPPRIVVGGQSGSVDVLQL